jgi:hypothetical protein
MLQDVRERTMLSAPGRKTDGRLMDSRLGLMV